MKEFTLTDELIKKLTADANLVNQDTPTKVSMAKKISDKLLALFAKTQKVSEYLSIPSTEEILKPHSGIDAFDKYKENDPDSYDYFSLNTEPQEPYSGIDIFDEYQENDTDDTSVYNYFTPIAESEIKKSLDRIKENLGPSEYIDNPTAVNQLEELWNHGSWDQVVETLYYSLQNSDVLLPYLKRIGNELVNNDTFILYPVNQNLLAELLIKIDSPESSQILESLLVWSRLTSVNLLLSDYLFNTALFCLMNEHKRRGESLNEWLGNFFYTLMLAHPTSFYEKDIRDTPLESFRYTEMIFRHVFEKILEKDIRFKAAKDDEMTQRSVRVLLRRFVREAVYQPKAIFLLEDSIEDVFHRNQHIPVDKLALILSTINSNFCQHIEIDDYISFVVKQFKSVEDINESSIKPFQQTEIIVQHIFEKILEKDTLFQAAKNDDLTQSYVQVLLRKVVKDAVMQPENISSLANLIKDIFHRNQHIDVGKLALILSTFNFGFYQHFEADDYINFVVKQFDSVEDIDEISLNANNMNAQYDFFTQHNRVMDALTSTTRTDKDSSIDLTVIINDRYTAFSRNAGLLSRNGKNLDVFDDFLSVYAILDESEKERQVKYFLTGLCEETLDISALIANQHMDAEALQEIVSFVSRFDEIRKRLHLKNEVVSLINRLFDSQDPLSLLSIFDFLGSEETSATLESWLADPNIRASWITSPQNILEAIYNYWSIDEIVEINNTLALAFGLPDNTAMQWGNFDFRNKIPSADLLGIQDIATSKELTENTESLRLFAFECGLNVQSLIVNLLGFSEFITRIKKGEFERLSSVRSIDLISYVEPKWFSILVDAMQERLSAKEGFTDLLEEIQTLIQGFENVRHIDGEDGLWRHRLVLNKDGSLVEDQTVYMVLRVEDGKPQLSIEFKLTRPTVGSATRKMSTISELKRWRQQGFVEEDVLAQRVDKLRIEIEKIAHYCSGCEFYHKNTEGDISSTDLEKLGYSEKEYTILLKSLKNLGENGKKPINTGIRYPSTPVAMHKLGAASDSIIEATAEFQPEPETLVASVGSTSMLCGYQGTLIINLDMSAGNESRQLALRLFAVLDMMGLTGVLSPVNESARRELAVNRYRWHRKINPEQSLDPQEVNNRLRLEDVFMGYKTFVEEGFHKELEQTGLAFLYSTMKSVSGVVGAFDVGLISSNQRRHLGIIRGGWSTSEDIKSGGSDYAFVRAATNPKSDRGEHEINLYATRDTRFLAVWDTAALDRTDWFAHHMDKYGSTKEEDLARRPDPITFVKEEVKDYSKINEVCFKRGIASRHLAFVITDTKENRTQIINELNERGITHHRGIPIEDCILTVPDTEHTWTSETIRFIKDRYSELRNRYTV